MLVKSKSVTIVLILGLLLLLFYPQEITRAEGIKSKIQNTSRGTNNINLFNNIPYLLDTILIKERLLLIGYDDIKADELIAQLKPEEAKALTSNLNNINIASGLNAQQWVFFIALSILIIYAAYALITRDKNEN